MNINPISISGYHMREAGATAAQEVAFTLANALEYVRVGVAAGLAGGQLRAAPVVLLRRAQRPVRGGGQVPRRAAALGAAGAASGSAPTTRPRRLRFHTQTGGVTLQAQQPLNNVVRVTVQALVGGARAAPSRCTPTATTRRSRCPTAEAATLALRTQQILGYESGVAEVIDPLGGSYYVEALTDRIEAEALALIEEVDALGGAAAAVEQGHFQEAIARSAWAAQQRQEAGDPGGGGGQPLHRRRASAGHRDAELRRTGGPAAGTAGGGARRAGTPPGWSPHWLPSGQRPGQPEPLMPAIVDAVRSRATLGEISDALRSVWGSYRPAR